MELFHGSHSKISEITSGGMFGGLFAAGDENAALSHGSVLHVIESPRPLSNYELNYETDGHRIALELADGNEELADAIMSKSCPDAGGFDGWEVQRLRGLVAFRLGYTSVEMLDEHGTTWLCLPGCAINAK